MAKIDDDFVLVNFEGEVPIKLLGQMCVPMEMWNRRASDENWSEEIQRYIVGRLDDPDYFDLSSFDERYIELDDVHLVTDDDVR